MRRLVRCHHLLNFIGGVALRSPLLCLLLFSSSVWAQSAPQLPSPSTLLSLQHPYSSWTSAPEAFADLTKRGAQGDSCNITSTSPYSVTCDGLKFGPHSLQSFTWTPSSLSTLNETHHDTKLAKRVVQFSPQKTTLTQLTLRLEGSHPPCEKNTRTTLHIQQATLEPGDNITLKSLTWSCGTTQLATAAKATWQPSTAQWEVKELSFESFGTYETLSLGTSSPKKSDTTQSGLLPPLILGSLENTSKLSLYQPFYLAPLGAAFGPVAQIEVPHDSEYQGPELGPAFGLGLTLLEEQTTSRADRALHLGMTLPWRGVKESAWAVGDYAIGQGDVHLALSLEKWHGLDEGAGRLLRQGALRNWDQSSVGLGLSSRYHQWQTAWVEDTQRFASDQGDTLTTTHQTWWSRFGTLFWFSPAAAHHLELPLVYKARRQKSEALGNTLEPPPSDWLHQIEFTPAVLWQWGTTQRAFFELATGFDIRYDLSTAQDAISASSRYAALMNLRGSLALEGRFDSGLKHTVKPEVIARFYPMIRGELDSQMPQQELFDSRGGYAALRLHQKLTSPSRLSLSTPVTALFAKAWNTEDAPDQGEPEDSERHMFWVGLSLGLDLKDNLKLSTSVHHCPTGDGLCEGDNGAPWSTITEVSWDRDAAIYHTWNGIGAKEFALLQELEPGGANRVLWLGQTGQGEGPTGVTQAVGARLKRRVHQFDTEAFMETPEERETRWGVWARYQYMLWPQGIQLGVDAAVANLEGLPRRVMVRAVWMGI